MGRGIQIQSDTMLRTLQGKLIAVFTLMLLLLALALALLGRYLNPLFLDELNQYLHRDLATNLAAETTFFQADGINHKGLKSIFMNLMKVNPAIEVYLLDPTGDLLAFSAEEGRVKRQHVDTAIIDRFIADSPLPLYGDDPRAGERKKVFSAAAIRDGEVLQGYLYIVLGGEAYDEQVQMITRSYVQRLSWFGMAALFLSALAAGTILFMMLTRRLRLLGHEMERYKQDDFRHLPTLPARFDGRPGDDLDRLGATFREMADRIQHQLRELRNTDAARRELVANVSHDLRTPLAALQGYLETLTSRIQEMSEEERHRSLHQAYQQSLRMGRRVAELFELAMLDARSSPPQHEPFSMNELLQDVAQKFQLKAGEKQIQLSTTLPQQMPFAHADIGLIERVLDNLIDNAIKYTPEGGRIRLSAQLENGQILTSISDSGRGIAEEELPHIFERFYRSDKHRDPAVEGSGLGLAIAQRILQLHHSHIEVRRETPQGTTFFFPLPASQ